MSRTWIVARSIAAATLLAASVGASADEQPQPSSAPQFGTWGIDLAGRDLAVDPGADFYLYAVGTWIKQTKIPPDKSRYGQFDRLSDLAQQAVRKLIEDAAAGHASDRDAGRIGAAYRSFLDEARADELDDKPLAPGLARIRAETTRADVAALMGTQRTSMQAGIFALEISADDKAPDRYTVFLRTSGSGLPDRDYYLKPELADAKVKYQAYVAAMLAMIGWPDPDANAKAIVELETKLAEARWTRAQARDPDANYHAMTVEELVRYAPGFDFRRLLDAAELGAVERVIVRTDTAFPKFAAIFAATPLDTIKAWQAFGLANRSAAYLSKRFVDASFAFYGRTITGQAEIKPRWKRAVDFTNGSLSEAIGRLYVAAHFPPSAKARAEAVVRQIMTAMRARIDRVTWMSAATKQRAQDKLAHMTIKVGYPAKWRVYDTLAMKPDDLYGNAERAEAFDWEYDVHRLNQPVDRTEWQMHPQTVNAQYDPSNNDLTIPAAILQPPFFDPNADMAVNYGGIGAVIGHEITHGFDDEGRKYDAEGRLAEWWTPQDAAAFEERAKRLGAQFDKFEPVKGFHVNGQLTMGENIADLGGMLLALDAYHAALGDKTAPVLDGLTGDQRFFLSWAQVWREKVTDPAAIMRVKTDPHAPSRFRVDGPVRNVDAWYKAFNIGPHEPMYLAPADRVGIW
jgi:putative endopeptidase